MEKTLEKAMEKGASNCLIVLPLDLPKVCFVRQKYWDSIHFVNEKIHSGLLRMMKQTWGKPVVLLEDQG